MHNNTLEYKNNFYIIFFNVNFEMEEVQCEKCGCSFESQSRPIITVSEINNANTQIELLLDSPIAKKLCLMAQEEYEVSLKDFVSCEGGHYNLCDICSEEQSEQEDRLFDEKKRLFDTVYTCQEKL